MTRNAATENILSLESLFGLSKEESEKIVGSVILLSAEDSYPSLLTFLKDILSRTFETVTTVYRENDIISCEIVIGDLQPRSTAAYVFLGETKENYLEASFSKPEYKLQDYHHSILYLLLACYTCALVTKRLIGKNPDLPAAEKITFAPEKLIPDGAILTATIDIGECYLAGAGAIGNAFLYTLQLFSVKGIIHVADDDFVDGGNLNRCLFFTSEDVSTEKQKNNKAEVLVAKTQGLFKELTLKPIPHRLQSSPAKEKGDADWLKKLIVGVDSRRARRNLQEELPGEVFDASTTGIEEVVLHYHQQPLNGIACLSCIYDKEEREQAREKHIAEALGVTLAQVNRQRIDEAAAQTISARYSLKREVLLGLSYDTLFKELCGEGKLLTVEDKQVIAPLAFVSVLAGSMLALLFVQRHLEEKPTYTYWRLSPWVQPNFRLQSVKEKNPHCEFCSSERNTKIAGAIWGNN